MNKSWYKKTFIGLTGLVALVTPFFLQAQDSATTTLQSTTNKIMEIIDGDNKRLTTVVEAIDDYSERYTDNEQVASILQELKSMVFDAFYQVEDFLSCETYFDGCNTCSIMDDGMLACTKKYCEPTMLQQPYCMSYQGDDAGQQTNDEKPLCDEGISHAERCTQNNGIWLDAYQECEIVNKAGCEKRGGIFDECGGACRHDPNAEICTLQCVPYCTFAEEDSDGSTDTPTQAKQRFKDNQELRKDQNMDTYTMQQQISCLCMQDRTQPVVYDVVNGVVDPDSIVYATSTDPVPEGYEVLRVEQAFDTIQNALMQEYEQVTVEYHPTLGYPRSIYIDQDSMIADEERSWTFNLIQ